MTKAYSKNTKNNNFYRSYFASDKIGKVMIYTLLLSIIILPLLHIFPAKESFFYINSYTITLLGKYLCFALLAMSLDLIWGYTGILSLGHGAFFGLGGYMMGMHLMREIGDREYMAILSFLILWCF